MSKRPMLGIRVSTYKCGMVGVMVHGMRNEAGNM